MNVYLAGCENRLKMMFPKLLEYGDMNVFLAGKGIYGEVIKVQRVMMLESFYYVNKWSERINPFLGGYLLDSGAFTFMTSAKNKKVDWDGYLRRYAAWINKMDVQRFFELDIDSIVGYDAVLRLRSELESMTGKRCIPVWHKSRGKAEFSKMCEEYDYVAIGGVVTNEILREQYRFFPSFIDEAHRRGAKIHCLGFTEINLLGQYHFDSVDSSSWTTGNRFGYVHKFDGQRIRKFHVPSGKRVKKCETAINNFNEWVKFQQYARICL